MSKIAESKKKSFDKYLLINKKFLPGQNGKNCGAVQFKPGRRIADAIQTIFKQELVDCFEEFQSLCLTGKV